MTTLKNNPGRPIGSHARPKRITFWLNYHPDTWTTYNGELPKPMVYKFVAIGIIKPKKDPDTDVFRVDMWETTDALPYSTIVQKGTSKAAFLEAAQQELARMSCPKCTGLCASMPDINGIYDKCFNCGWTSDTLETPIQETSPEEAVQATDWPMCIGPECDRYTRSRAIDLCAPQVKGLRMSNLHVTEAAI